MVRSHGHLPDGQKVAVIVESVLQLKLQAVIVVVRDYILLTSN